MLDSSTPAEAAEQWDDAAGAPRGTTMVTERQAALASAVPRESELRPGLRLVALFPNAFDGEPFACELIGTATQGRVAVRFDDGLEHESTVRRSPIPERARAILSRRPSSPQSLRARSSRT